jgi:hypothetical protein
MNVDLLIYEQEDITLDRGYTDYEALQNTAAFSIFYGTRTRRTSDLNECIPKAWKNRGVLSDQIATRRTRTQF